MISFLCRVAVATGMRFGELTALRWDDVNLLDDEIVVVAHVRARLRGELDEERRAADDRPDSAGEAAP